jgi:hypothetical protein
MQTRSWLLMTISMILGGGGALLGFNISVDLYGLYRHTEGRRLVVYGDERVTKYLLNARYVPENFNSILIGSSASANWDMRGIEKLRVYNDSLNGGNIVEEKALVDSALSRPGISIAFLLVHPYLTSSHEFETVKLIPQLRVSALGSQSLWDAYKDILKIRLHRSQLMTDYAGTTDLGIYPSELTATLKHLWRPDADFELDPIALGAYREVVAKLRAHNIQIVFVVPPTFEDLLQRKWAAFDKYTRIIRSEMAAGDEWIDFTSGAHADFRKNRSNFGDGVHLVPKAAEQVVSYINAKTNDWIAEGRLHLPATAR